MKKTVGVAFVYIVVTVAMIAVLSGGYYLLNINRAAGPSLITTFKQSTMLRISSLRDSFAAYRVMHSQYPASEDELSGFLEGVDRDGQIIPGHPLHDGWGNRFRIFSTSRYYFIQSFGENGVNDNGCLDDIIYFNVADQNGEKGTHSGCESGQEPKGKEDGGKKDGGK